MQVKIKTLSPGASRPTYKTQGASGFDLEAYLPYPLWIGPRGYATIPTGLAFEIPDGFELQVRPRSGHGSQGILAMFGTVDSDYRGEVKVTVYNHTQRPFVVESGMRLAQGVIAPVVQVDFVETSELSPSVRGEDGFGSTGR